LGFTDVVTSSPLEASSPASVAVDMIWTAVGSVRWTAVTYVIAQRTTCTLGEIWEATWTSIMRSSTSRN